MSRGRTPFCCCLRLGSPDTCSLRPRCLSGAAPKEAIAGGISQAQEEAPPPLQDVVAAGFGVVKGVKEIMVHSAIKNHPGLAIRWTGADYFAIAKEAYEAATA